VRMTISDTGIGSQLPEEHSKYSPYRLERGAGSGLRLATIQSIVIDLRGKISMESAPGAGTNFYLDLPIDGTAPAPEPEPPAVEAVAEEGPAVSAPAVMVDAQVVERDAVTLEKTADATPGISPDAPHPLVAEIQAIAEKQTPCESEEQASAETSQQKDSAETHETQQTPTSFIL
jgi:hypothetical protein